MYALYRKIVNGYSVDVDVLAVSESEEELMALLPYEVERYIRSKCKRILPYEMELRLGPKGHEPRKYWARGAFDEERFEVVGTSDVRIETLRCKSDVIKYRKENEDYLKEIADYAKKARKANK